MAKKISKKSMLPSPKDRKSKTIKKEEKPKRRPPRKPNTKIFDFIGDILKTPYIIRGGKAKGGLIKGKPKLAKRGF